MRLLLDTHALLWFAWNHPSLSVTARQLITDPNNELLLSPASYWEVAIKIGVGKLTLTTPFVDFIEGRIAKLRLVVLPITPAHTAPLTSLALHHRDPFDRLLIAQAISEQVPLVSSDQRFDAYNIARLW